jgi:hypothetical protein
VADGGCWFVLREEYCWLVAGGWFIVREKYCWLLAAGWWLVSLSFHDIPQFFVHHRLKEHCQAHGHGEPNIL